MDRRPVVVALSVASFLAVMLLVFAFRQRPERARKVPFAARADVQTQTEPTLRLEAPPIFQAPDTTAAPPPLSVSQVPALDEMSQLRKLRELRGSDPALTLQLARDAQQRFKNGPDDAEFSWFVIKSLSDLARHDEARVEGRKLVHDFPGNSFAEDAYRHLFVNPPTDPSERGYGKELELQ